MNQSNIPTVDDDNQFGDDDNKETSKMDAIDRTGESVIVTPLNIIVISPKLSFFIARAQM